MEDIILYFNRKEKLPIDIPSLKDVYAKIYTKPSFEVVESESLIVLATSKHQDNLKNNILYSEKDKTYIFITGTLFSQDIIQGNTQILKKNFPDESSFLINVYESLGIEGFKSMNGWFNILTYSQENHSIKLINSRLGMDMLYIYSSGDEIIISNRLIVYKYLLQDFQVNYAVVLQQSLYNYPFSNHSIVKDVQLLPSASIAYFQNDGSLKMQKYWSLKDELTSKPLGFNESVEVLDEKLDAVVKRYLKQTDKRFALSLTGGWDGRLLLAYALKYIDPKELLLYSFGVENSPDMTIPKDISDRLGYRYMSIPLDTQYMEEDFYKWSSATVINSDSGRSLKRAHYLYAMQKLSSSTDIVLTGIGGSNLLKSSAYAPCNVFNKFVLEIIHTSDLKATLSKHYEYIKQHFGEYVKMVSLEDFIISFETDEIDQLINKTNKSERFTEYLVSNIERKYFGGEVKSYRHLITNYSPFFDYEFLSGLLKTMFFGGYPTKNPRLAVFQNSLLYARLISRNNKPLAKQATDRGFSMNELLNPLLYGNLGYKYIKHRQDVKKNPFSHYNTDNALNTFLQNSKLDLRDLYTLENTNKEFVANYISIQYFLKSM